MVKHTVALLCMCIFAHSQQDRHTTVPAGPVYEDIKEEIELKSNQAYGPVGGH